MSDNVENNKKLKVDFETITKFAKVVVAVSIPILYLQGLAYHQGQLGGLKVRSDFYPLSLEDALLEAFSFYLESIKIIACVALGWFIFSLIVTYLEKKVVLKVSRGKVFLFLEKYVNFLISTILKNKSNFLGPGLLFFSIYAMISLGVIVALPYAAGVSKGSHKFEKIRNSYPDDSQLISVKNDKKTTAINGVIIKTSKNFISFYDGTSLFTLPIGNIESIENNSNTKPNKKINPDGK